MRLLRDEALAGCAAAVFRMPRKRKGGRTDLRTKGEGKAGQGGGSRRDAGEDGVKPSSIFSFPSAFSSPAILTLALLS